MSISHHQPRWSSGRALEVLLSVIGALTLLAALFLLLLLAHAHDFCDATCNRASVHLWEWLSSLAAAFSLVQLIAGIAGRRRLAAGSFLATWLVLAVLFVPLINFS